MMVDYELEALAAGVLRRRLRVRLRFGLSLVAVSTFSVSSLVAGLAAAFVFAVSLSFAAFEVSLLFWPWSICSKPTAPLSSLTDGCLAIG